MSTKDQQKPTESPEPSRERRKRRPHTPPPSLAAELVSGDSYTLIAKRHRVDRGTVAGWAAKEAVQAEVAKLTDELRERTRQKVIAGHDTSLDVLITLARNPRVDKNVRVKAAGELGRLTQPKEAQKVEVNLTGGVDLTLSDEELAAKAAATLAKLGG